MPIQGLAGDTKFTAEFSNFGAGLAQRGHSQPQFGGGHLVRPSTLAAAGPGGGQTREGAFGDEFAFKFGRRSSRTSSPVTTTAPTVMTPCCRISTACTERTTTSPWPSLKPQPCTTPPWGGASEADIKRAWWEQVFGAQTHAQFPNLKMINWFEWDKNETEVNGRIDWTITNTPAIRDAFTAALQYGAGTTCRPAGS